MLIGGDDTSNDAVTLGTCFLMFVYSSARFCFSVIGGNMTAQSTRSHSGKLSFLFPPRRQSALERVCSQATM